MVSVRTNVVNFANIATPPRVPWAGTEIQHIHIVLENFSVAIFRCLLLFVSEPVWLLTFFVFFVFSVLLVNVIRVRFCSLTWRTLGRCLYNSVLGMLQCLYSNSMNDRVLWKHQWNLLYYSSPGLGFLLYCYMLQAWHNWEMKNLIFLIKLWYCRSQRIAGFLGFVEDERLCPGKGRDVARAHTLALTHTHRGGEVAG